MTDDREMIKVIEPDDPNRCQGTWEYGQCPYKAVPNGTFCMRCGGNKQLDKIEKESTDMYRVDMFRARIAKMKGNSEVKSLSNEVAILRMVLEEQLNGCQNETDLILHSARISDLIIKIDKLVVSCHKLEKNLGQHLDKSALLQFASEVVALIGDKVANKDEVQAVADGILQIIGNSTGISEE